MRIFLLVSLFAILLSDIMLGLGLSLAPGLSLKNAMLYILFIALVLEFTVGQRDPLKETWPLHVLWMLLVTYATFTWLVIVLLGVHRGYDGLLGFITLKGQLVDLFLFLLVYLYGPKDAASTLSLLRWLIAVLIVVNIITMVDVFNVPDLGIIIDRDDGRLAGPLKEVNQYGAVLIFIVPITAGLAFASRGMLRMCYGIGTLIALILLGLTVSRGSYVGLLAGGAIGLYLVRDYVRREAIVRGSIVGFIVLILVAGVTAYQNPDGFFERFSVSGVTLYGVSSGRTFFWQQALTIMSSWPFSFISGYGWNAYPTLLVGYGDPHNTYLLYWFNLGLLGLILYVVIVYWILRFAVRGLRDMPAESRPIIIGLILGLLALHFALFFVELYSSSLFIWAIAGTTLRLLVEDLRLDHSQSKTIQTSEKL
ncbi:MAG: O-antigen ligase family protein [Woeseiaceae bacterium]